MFVKVYTIYYSHLVAVRNSVMIEMYGKYFLWNLFKLMWLEFKHFWNLSPPPNNKNPMKCILIKTQNYITNVLWNIVLITEQTNFWGTGIYRWLDDYKRLVCSKLPFFTCSCRILARSIKVNKTHWWFNLKKKKNNREINWETTDFCQNFIELLKLFIIRKNYCVELFKNMFNTLQKNKNKL